jgi:hypothetical protein
MPLLIRTLNNRLKAPGAPVTRALQICRTEASAVRSNMTGVSSCFTAMSSRRREGRGPRGLRTEVRWRPSARGQARAGFINKEFDLFCLDKLVHEPEVLTRYTVPQLVELAGSQRVELLTWIAMRGALPGRVTQIHRNYHVPISNTATGLLVLENSASTEDSAVRAAKALA